MPGSTEPSELNHRILVVDEDTMILEMVSRMLSHEGYEVLFADSVASAAVSIDSAAERPFDAAILDVTLPDGSGFDIVELLREGQMPCGVVMMTGSPRSGHGYPLHRGGD